MGVAVYLFLFYRWRNYARENNLSKVPEAVGVKDAEQGTKPRSDSEATLGQKDLLMLFSNLPRRESYIQGQMLTLIMPMLEELGWLQ